MPVVELKPCNYIRGFIQFYIIYESEQYLIFLNILQLERQGADLQTKIEELRIINQSLRENDKVKEDNALAPFI